MQNLAGHREATAIAAQELADAGIPIVQLAEPYGEPRAVVGGELDGFVFRRAWYYWIVTGPMPLELAERMYTDPIGRRDVRVAGHCGCPPPGEWATRRRIPDDGRELILDPDGAQEAEFEEMCKRHPSMKELGKGYCFVRKLPTKVASFVGSYHVDSAEGLKLLADTIKSIASGCAGASSRGPADSLVPSPR